MLIENGILKNLSLEVIKEKGLRPTKSRIRSSLFDILSHKIFFPSYHFFDLFAGSGAVGVEALSRGFVKSYFFDYHKKIFGALQKNLQKIPKNFSVECFFGDTFLCLQKLANLKNFSKVFFIDAPYTFLYEKDLLLFIKKISCKKDILVIEKDQDLTKTSLMTFLESNNFSLLKNKKYGKIYMHFWEL